MDEEMVEDTSNEEEEEEEYAFTAYEVDLDYEFEAARFFDFSREESPLEARQAEVWFDSAGSYPPSPFVPKLVPGEETLMEHVSISPKSKGMESTNVSHSNYDIEVNPEISATDMHYEDEANKGTSSTIHIGSLQKFQNPSQKSSSGLTSYDYTGNNVNSENQTKLAVKLAPRTSTLMKPTVSQLAKQNRPFQAGFSRSHASVSSKTSKSSVNSSVIENQAAKRQKLEGGLPRKVVGTALQQQSNFVHKVPKRDGFLDGNTTRTKPRITVPRDPDLETANRAQRLRAKSSKDENVTSTVRRFKALPLNRKILEAPSLLLKRSTPCIPDFQEFHLKTSERAMQHSSAVLKSTVPWNNSDKQDLHKYATNLTAECGNREPGRPSIVNDAPRPDGCQSSHIFKALPLNKKILTSKGDIGIFRSSKKGATVPMDFNFQLGKRLHDNPPIELFSKLSLASEAHIADSETKGPQSINISEKGSKENKWGFFQQGNEKKLPAKLKLPLLGGKQQLRIDERKNEVNTPGNSWSSRPIR